MKKMLTAAVALGLTLSLTACGESLQRPVETSPTEPLWAVAPEQRPTVDPAEAMLTEAVTEAAVPETTVPVPMAMPGLNISPVWQWRP